MKLCLNASLRGCADSMSNPFLLGHTWRSNVWACIFSLLHITHILLRIIIKLGPSVQPTEYVHKAWAILVQCQCHISGSNVCTCSTYLLQISRILLRIFIKLGSNVEPTETICRRHKLVILLTLLKSVE